MSISTSNTSVEDAREAFLVELASFHLSLKKSLMVCEAEARQVEEYQRERERIGMFVLFIYSFLYYCLLNYLFAFLFLVANEHDRTKSQLDELKMSLEQAQLDRRRKMEYDVIAEKINALPSRDELERYASTFSPLAIIYSYIHIF